MNATLVIADDRAVAEFDAYSGGLVGLRDRTAGALVHSPETPSLYVLEIPRHGDRTVVVATAAQQVTSTRVGAGGRSLTAVWERPVTSTGEKLDGRIEVTAALDDGRLRLALELSLDAEVEAVRFPSIEGIAPADGDELELLTVDYSQGARVRLLPRFDSNAPYWGTLYPDYASGNLRPEVVCNPTSPFAVLAGRSGGLTVLPSSPTLEFIGWRVSLRPGFRDSLSRTAEPVDGRRSVTFDAIQMPRQSGGRLTALPMTVAPFAGDWPAALAPYRDGQGAARSSGAAWLREPRSWLQVQLMSTEGEPRYDFDALTRIVEECAAHGIGAIQVVGWNEGGQDGLVPVHRPAEKLGGEAGLRRALQRARELDVKTVLYVKYQWVERPGQSWDELAEYVCLDANGQPYAQPGPVYHTSRKRYGMSTPWYVPLCFSSPVLRARFAAEVAQLASWGAAGVLADESLYHGRALLCFAEGHDHPPGASTYLWDGDFVEDLRTAAAASARDFVIAGEGAYDQQFEHYDASYFRSSSERHLPLGRYLRPRARIVTALTGFDDRNMANQCLLYGYAMSLEPYNFKGRPADMPATVAYATAVDDLRRRLAPWLWNGTFAGTEGVAVTAPDRRSRHAQVAVWESPDRPGRCVVIANYDDEQRSYEVHLPPAMTRPGVLRVGEEAAEPLRDGRVVVGPRSAVVVADEAILSTGRTR
ncbi:DUF6259 domain-containing protein [Jiangella rhizosphaerae]|uniref:DUF6259 domain-containing protein n=1 Tax=Jiangella rhizosphaerae TaxID=2293569 RepID=A0A418KKX7_9ACTN|nr:DUF6259 domain-containing protein [Jiangella rhizosphaerae]RIQ17835.1 hypothetical protein DY240_22120 [Jiangella rhizosphaerae]